ncbi:MAG: SEC-C domain-containing protein [Deltaproteobacteria bacterium]|nr:SEC-C domain-containing protein [Deltaproteobacteria bacterium]
MPKRSTRFQSLSDADLLDLLYTSGDELPRQAVHEFLRRGRRMIPALHAIVADKTSWTQPLPEWWAAVHAAYILGAMEDPSTLPSLLIALRWSDAFDCDWITEDLPSMFGRLGRVAYDPLRAVAADATAGWGARSIALLGMAAIGLNAQYLMSDTLTLAAEFLGNRDEELYLRQTAANILLDFQSHAHSELLRSFGKEESERKAEDPEYKGVYYDWELDELLAEGESTEDIEYYRRDWLVFYEPEETAQRQERWRREQEEAALQVPEEESAPRRDITAPCPCGSGKPFDRCCYLKVH